MDIDTFICNQFRQKSVMLVGNAAFAADRSDIIDSHDVVIRFNLFRSSSFEAKRCGQKLSYWVVNLDSGRKSNSRARERRANLVDQCAWLRARYPDAILMSPHAEDKHKRLRDAVLFYEANGLRLLHADSNRSMPLRMEATVGFYMSYRILQQGIPFAMIGFNGDVNPKYHDGDEEMRYWQDKPLIKFHMTPRSN